MAHSPHIYTHRAAVAVLAAIGVVIAAVLPAVGQCAGDCNADGRVAVHELVTMVNVALGDVPLVACSAGDANIDDRVTVAELIAAVADALAGCGLRRTYDFRGGPQGWQEVFADYTPEMEDSLELEAGQRPLPDELNLAGEGFLLSGFNQSDDLFMGLHRRLTPADGIEPGRPYTVEYIIAFASAAPSGCPGIGGAPGESVYMKAGAAGVAPMPLLDPIDDTLRMNVDIGNQSAGGLHLSVFGDAANGLPCEGDDRFVSLRYSHRHPHPITASAEGELWLMVGSDSGYEGTSALYYQRIDVALTPSEALHLNDVSVLFPLPEPAGVTALIPATAIGSRGPLLPVELYERLPKLHVFQSPEQTYALLRVVALRIDPCFVTAADCRRQLRLSMQPLSYDAFLDAVRAEDAAVHLFYDLSDEDFYALVEDLRSATAGSPLSTAGPLSVHPILAAEGLAGPFAEQLRAAVLRHAGASNLSRITFMQLQNFNVNEWVFGGFDLEAGEVVPVVIPDAGSEHQRFINVILESDEDFVASVDPPRFGDDDFGVLYNSTAARAADPAVIEAAERATLRVENPAVHSTESVSCVVCHTATQARLWTERSLGRDTVGHPDRYTAAADLTLTSETTRVPGSLRAFGYLHQRVAISQRTVNESAAVVAQLNAARPPFAKASSYAKATEDRSDGRPDCGGLSLAKIRNAEFAAQ